MLRHLLALLAASITMTAASAEGFKYKDRLLAELVRQVPDILKTYDAHTGHFGKGIWICTDQNLMFPLAVAYARQGEENRYYKDKLLLEACLLYTSPSPRDS